MKFVLQKHLINKFFISISLYAGGTIEIIWFWLFKHPWIAAAFFVENSSLIWIFKVIWKYESSEILNKKSWNFPRIRAFFEQVRLFRFFAISLFHRNNLVNSYSFFRGLSQMLCIGYGQFPPQCLSDMFTILGSMLMGAILFAIFIGVASSMYHSMDCSKRLYKEKYNSGIRSKNYY